MPSPISSDVKLSPKWKLYISTMLIIIRKSISLANAPSLTESEHGQRSKDWAEFLFDIVPENRLMETFARAVADHTSTFPVNFYDMKSAWQQIAAEELAAKAAAIERDRQNNPVKYCDAPERHINADGDTEILLGGPGGKTVVVPCPICRPRANQARIAEEMRRAGDRK